MRCALIIMAGIVIFNALFALILININTEVISTSSDLADLEGILLNLQNMISTRFDNLEIHLVRLKHNVATEIDMLNRTFADMMGACECKTGHGFESRPLSEMNSDRIDRVSVRIQNLERKLGEHMYQVEETFKTRIDQMMKETHCRTTTTESSGPNPCTTTDSSTTSTTPTATTATIRIRSTPRMTTIGETSQPPSSVRIQMTASVSTQRRTSQTSTLIVGTRSTLPSTVTASAETTTPDIMPTTTQHTSTVNPPCNAADPIYKHLKEREDFSLTGYIPTNGSGVTIATGVDLGQQSESGLRALGVKDDIIRKLRPYLGLKTEDAVLKAGLVASNLKLTEDEACLLDSPLLVKTKSIVKPYGAKMTIKGMAVLVSLKHWAGALGNTRGQGKLSITVGKGKKNFVWDTIKGKTATDSDLKSALEKTLRHHTPKTGGYNRINHEIQYLSM